MSAPPGSHPKQSAGVAPQARSRPRLRLGPGMRLRRPAEFANLRAQGQRLVRGCLVANWMRLPESASHRLGVVTGRGIGSACVRNRARRLLREAFRRHQHEYQWPVAVVLVARSSIAGKRFVDVDRDVQAVFRRAGILPPASL